MIHILTVTRNYLIMKNIVTLVLSFSLMTPIFSQLPEKLSVDSLFENWNSINVPGGSISIIKNGEIIYANGYGSADLEHDIPITPSTVFYIGSTSKQFVTFCILLLEEQGKINLDDKIQNYFPDFPEYDSPLTIRHFIHHTSGVRDYLTLMYLKGRSYLDHSEVSEVYDLVKNQSELNFSPGDQYLYSNSCYFMLALIAEKASGKSLREFAHENIFKPLGMNNSLFYDDISDMIRNRAFSYEKTESGFKNLVSRFDLVGSGGVYSTVLDLALWDQNFYQNKLGKGGQEIIDKMHQEGVLNSGKTAGYAFALINGTYRGLNTVNHGGSLAGYRSQLLRFPDQKFSVIVLANRSDADSSGKAYNIADIFLADQFIEKDQSETNPKRKNRDIKLDKSHLTAFCASYWNDKESYSRKIYLKNDTLRYSRNVNNESKLVPIGKNEFRMEGVSADLLVRFERNSDNVKSMIVTLNNGTPSESIAYKPITYEIEDYKKYEGSFYSKELNVSYDLATTDDKLILYVDGKEISSMDVIKEYTLSNGNFGVFEFFGSSGGIEGFKLMAGRVKNLRFTKN